ncbi:MAG: hypothetical protein WBN11_13415 [Eudoraea sp.]|uniref:hypothetical protein n=2 Tax=Eudoraea sp. TaxID=1979955 RepID=UPI003C783650
MRKLLYICVLLLAITAKAQDTKESDKPMQDDTSKALDATATQWSFQFAYQFMPDYHSDLVNGVPRRAGLDNYVQLRIVAPIPLKGLTILPRVTIRHYEDVNTGNSGFGNTEIFALMIPSFSDWGTGRAGIGPMVTLPGNKDVARDEWGYGLSGAVVNSSGPWFYGILLTQSFRAIDPSALPTGSSDTNPLGIAPFLNYTFGSSGYYLGNGDMVALYDWNNSAFYLPVGLRFGKVWVLEKGSINAYAEYQTSAIYKNYQGPAVKNSFRVNFTYTMPVGRGKK